MRMALMRALVDLGGSRRHTCCQPPIAPSFCMQHEMHAARGGPHIGQALDVGGGIAHDVQVAVLLRGVAPHPLRILLCTVQAAALLKEASFRLGHHIVSVGRSAAGLAVEEEAWLLQSHGLGSPRTGTMARKCHRRIHADHQDLRDSTSTCDVSKGDMSHEQDPCRLLTVEAA